ncbi:MAG: NADH-quinone oxidoreductase subunit H [Opitutae bacterium]|nr:NADH-quinone oxidoreductase subunit H [Opitutae bacterium]
MDAFAKAFIELFNGSWLQGLFGIPDIPATDDAAAVTGAIFKAIFAIILVVVIMVCCLYTVLLERKTAAWAQGRVGPCRTTMPIIAAIPVVGRVLTYCGFIQPLADGGKLFLREEPVPEHVNKFYYCLAPCFALAPAIITLVMMPFSSYIDPETGKETALMLCNMNPGFVFVFAVSSLGVYGTVFGGWASNSKYPFLGSIRSGAQLISYELSMVLSVLPVVLLTSSNPDANPLSLLSIVQEQSGMWNVIFAPLSAILFFVTLMAEMSRQPFDMPESETDTVGGFHTEYGTFKFGLFYTGEYLHMILGSTMFSLLFLGGWHALPFMPTLGLTGVAAAILGIICLIIKILIVLFIIIWIRWTVPRFRFDQVMRVGWQLLLPFALANFVAYVIGIGIYDALLK